MTGPESLSLAEVAQILTAETGRSVRYRPETIEEVNSSREGYGAPGWQVDASVTTYTAIAVGEVAEVTDDVPRLSGHPATSLAELLRRGASVRAGDHAPHIAGAVGDRLRDVLRSASGHVVLTIAAPDGTAPVAESDGAVRVLVADDSDQAAGFDAVVADPGRSVASRYALPHGGLAVIRPDGYLGLVGGLDADVAGYFSNIVGRSESGARPSS